MRYMQLGWAFAEENEELVQVEKVEDAESFYGGTWEAPAGQLVPQSTVQPEYCYLSPLSEETAFEDVPWVDPEGQCSPGHLDKCEFPRYTF